jgi:hypothetical protein
MNRKIRLNLEFKIRLAHLLNARIRKCVSFASSSAWFSHTLKMRIFDFGFLFLGKYYSTHNAGLFSIVSTVASDCVNYGIAPKKISLTFTAHYYKTYFFEDPWKNLFMSPAIDSNQAHYLNNSARIHDWWDKTYEFLDYAKVERFAENFLRPTSRTTLIIDELCNKYSIKIEKTLTVHYRGTDKVSEIALVEVHKYILRIRQILQELKGLDVLILTDDSQAYEMFLNAFPEAKSLVNELPTSEGGVGAHEAKKLDRSQDAVFYFASVLIASKSKIIVTHTGNGGLWERIFRGTDDGFIQMR